MDSSLIVLAVFKFVLLIFSLSFHECCHAWVASLLGDQTARMHGRVTLNPAAHVDPIGTLLFPAIAIFGPLFNFPLRFMLIGWAKPVPVNTRFFRKIVRDDNLVSMAGPAANLLLAAVGTVVLVVVGHLSPQGPAMALSSFEMAIQGQSDGTTSPLLVLASLAIVVNLSLTFFNLLPIPPLDGSHVVRNMLPYNAVKVYDQVSGWLSIILMMTVGGYLMQMAVTPLLRFVYGLLLGMQPQQMLLMQ